MTSAKFWRWHQHHSNTIIYRGLLQLLYQGAETIEPAFRPPKLVVDLVLSVQGFDEAGSAASCFVENASKHGTGGWFLLADAPLWEKPLQGSVAITSYKATCPSKSYLQIYLHMKESTR